MMNFFSDTFFMELDELLVNGNLTECRKKILDCYISLQENEKKIFITLVLLFFSRKNMNEEITYVSTQLETIDDTFLSKHCKVHVLISDGKFSEAHQILLESIPQYGNDGIFLFDYFFVSQKLGIDKPEINNINQMNEQGIPIDMIILLTKMFAEDFENALVSGLVSDYVGEIAIRLLQLSEMVATLLSGNYLQTINIAKRLMIDARGKNMLFYIASLYCNIAFLRFAKNNINEEMKEYVTKSVGECSAFFEKQGMDITELERLKCLISTIDTSNAVNQGEL